MSEKVVEVIRSGVVESIHLGNIAVVDCNGKMLSYLGEPEQIGYLRSSAKPLILLSHLMKKIHEHFHFSLQELAVMASSHSGGSMHIEVISGIAKKLDIKESDLTCGVREPFGESARYELYGNGQTPGQFHNNCSGKHLGNIAACKVMGYSWDSVTDPSHPVQKDILKIIAAFCDLPKESIHLGVDGCGVPVFGVPLKNMALAYARLFQTSFMGGKYSNEQQLLYQAVTTYPEMIAAEDRIDTKLARLTKGDHFGKMGADGVFCVHIQSKGMGIAVKIQDGSIRAVDPVVMETLAQLNTLPPGVLEELRVFHYPKIQTWSGKDVGMIKPVFTLKT